MIKITNNIETKTVTKGAYENFYKSLGFTVVNDGKPITKAQSKEIKKDSEIKDEEIKKDSDDTKKFFKDNGKQTYSKRK